MHRRKSVWVLAAMAAFTAALRPSLKLHHNHHRNASVRSFGPIGLASSETAQINVVNTAAASSSGTAASCTGSVSFVNASGAERIGH